MAVQEEILAVFYRKPRLCIHQLAEESGLPRSTLRYALVELQKIGRIKKVSEVKGDNVYQLKHEPKEAQLDTAVSPAYLPVAFGLEEETARDRVIMLKRMKSRLIREYHPILDVFIEDYERGLKAIELLRYGPDDDDDSDDLTGADHV